MIRRIAAVVAAMAMLLVLAVPVLAGGWAEIVADGQTVKPPVEGQPTEVGFKVMQHGETPAPWETATVHFTNAATGESFDVTATNDRPDGHFVATATMPSAGYWSWHVTLADLASEQVPVRMTVLTTSGSLPPFDPSIALNAIERAKTDIRTELTQQFTADIQRLEEQVERSRARIAYLDSAVASAAADAGVAGSDSGLPIVGVIALAVLAGGVAGFAMSWLAGRPRRPASSVELKPAPTRADPI